MISNLVSLFSNAIVSQTANSRPVAQTKSISSNPFEGPFISNNAMSSTRQNFYGKNNPLKGGYFAGYYNGQPNIVGRRLFVEV